MEPQTRLINSIKNHNDFDDNDNDDKDRKNYNNNNKYEPCHEKTNNEVFEQVRHKQRFLVLERRGTILSRKKRS